MVRDGARVEPPERRLEELHEGGLQVGSALKGSEQPARFGVAPPFADGDTHPNRARHEIRPLERLARLRLGPVENLGCQDASKAGEGELAGAPQRHEALSDLRAIVLLANGSHSVPEDSGCQAYYRTK